MRPKPSEAEADESLQTRKDGTRESTGTLLKIILKLEEGRVPDGNERMENHRGEKMSYQERVQEVEGGI